MAQESLGIEWLGELVICSGFFLIYLVIEIIMATMMMTMKMMRMRMMGMMTMKMMKMRLMVMMTHIKVEEVVDQVLHLSKDTQHVHKSLSLSRF